jgi:maltooligosyltrehalose trehalohydrolase
VWAPAARSAAVELSDSGRELALERDDDGVWAGLVRDARAGSRYWYRLDGQLSRPDPYSRSQPDGVHGPSQVQDPRAFEWHDQSWRGLGIKGLVIYQTHIGTATPEGTLDSLAGQLPRLNDLGVNAVQLLPLAEFPGTRNWGYDGVDLFAVSRNYGGPQALKRFVNAAHAHELGVILDVVYNHLGPDGNYLRDFSAEYFTDRYHTPWGAAINYSNRWVRKYVIDNACYWLREYHIDGLRLDATHAIFDPSRTHILAELTQTVRASMDGERKVVLIAETGENEVRYLESVDAGGFGLDAVYADDFHHSLRRYLAGDGEGYYADYAGTLEEVARIISQGWLYEGQPTPSSNFTRGRGTSARTRPAWQFIYAIQNHDQVGNRAFGERLHHQIGIQRFAAASALLLFLPSTPLLFQGQEFAASTPFQFFTDHQHALGKLVTEGRRREFQAFSAFADPAKRTQIPDPQAEATFVNSKLRLEESETPPGSEMQAWYQALLKLRRTDRVLIDQARERMTARAFSADVLSVRRWLVDGDERVLLVNFGDSPFEAAELGGTWRLLLASGPGAETTFEALRAPPRTAVIAARGPG